MAIVNPKVLSLAGPGPQGTNCSSDTLEKIGPDTSCSCVIFNPEPAHVVLEAFALSVR